MVGERSYSRMINKAFRQFFMERHQPNQAYEKNFIWRKRLSTSPARTSPPGSGLPAARDKDQSNVLVGPFVARNSE